MIIKNLLIFGGRSHDAPTQPKKTSSTSLTGVKVKGWFRKKICEIFGVYHLLYTARKYDEPKYFWKSKNKSRKVQSHFLLLSFRFDYMKPQTFELSKKYGFSHKDFFGKVRETSIHSESFLKFDSEHFGI